MPLSRSTARPSPRPGSARWSRSATSRRRCAASARPFLLEGEVVEGDKRGRELGFPTANIVPDEELVYPGHGVYAGFADGRPAAIHIGVRPMFETGRGVLVEPHIIDWDGDLYGRTLRLAFIARLRGEKRFPSVEELIAADAPRRRGEQKPVC